MRQNEFWFLYGYIFVIDTRGGIIVKKRSTIIQVKFFRGYKYDSWVIKNQNHYEANLINSLAVSGFRIQERVLYFICILFENANYILFALLVFAGAPFVDLTIILVPFSGDNESGWLPDDTLSIMPVNSHL